MIPVYNLIIFTLVTKRIECTPSKTRKNYSIDKSSSSKNTPQKNYSAYKTVRKRSSSIQFNNFPPKILDLNLSSVKNNIESTTSCKSLYNNLDHILDDNENSGSKSDNNRFCTPRSFAWESSTMKDHINTFITMLHNNNTPSKKNFSKDNADIHITTIEPLILPEKIDTEVQTDAEDSSMSVSKTVTFDLNTKGGGEQFLIQEQNRLLRDYHNQLEAYRKKIESLEKRDEERKKNIEQFKKILLFFAEDAIDSGSNSNKGGNQNQFEMNALIEMLLSRLEKQSNDFDDIIQMQQVNRNSLLSTLNHAEEELDCSISKLKKDIASMRESILIQNKKIDAIILSRIEDFKRASAQLEASKSL